MAYSIGSRALSDDLLAIHRAMKVGLAHLAMHMTMLGQADGPRQEDADQQAQGQPQAVVRMELNLGQQVTQRDTQENPRRESQGRRQHDVFIREILQAEIKDDGTNRAHQGIPEVSHISRSVRPATRCHDGRDRQ